MISTESFLLYLHSTMFLLILWRSVYSGAVSSFTFHYVSTYTNTQKIAQKRVNNLHSTMFLLIRKHTPYHLPVESIYIPLCFYLYEIDCRVATVKSKFTFHYVSTYTDYIRADMIYPLSIYIPLCFYLYPVSRRWPPGSDEFTFHYVSTYTIGATAVQGRKI